MMRAMVLENYGSIETTPLKLRVLPPPIPKEGEIRIRVHYCAICRTDLHVIEGELPQRKLPIIPGHQVIGVVDQLGLDCRRFPIGTRVGIAWLRSTCGTCRYCRSEKENLCPNSEYTGYTHDGGYSDYLIVREDFAYPIPNCFNGPAAAPLLCSGIIGYRTLQRSHLPKKNGKLGIFGFGSAAHIVIQLAQWQHARVFVVSRDLRHLEFAKSLGAFFVTQNSQNLPEYLDSAILFAPAGELVPEALSALDKGGTLAIGGIHLSPIPALDYEKHIFYEKELRSVTANTRQDGYSLLRAAAEIPIETHTQIYPLEAANQALLDLKTDRIKGTGVLNCLESSMQSGV